MLALRTAAVALLLAALVVAYLAFRTSTDNHRAPGQIVINMGEQFGWTCRPDPFQRPLEGFFFNRPGVDLPHSLLLAPVAQIGPEWEGRLHVRRAPRDAELVDEGQPWCQRVNGWLLFGDERMVEMLARELASSPL
jgi:hypothetical protein